MRVISLRSKIATSLLFFTIAAALLTNAIAAEPKKTYTDPVTGMPFVYIPGGTFNMGNATEIWGDPVHQVSVPPFYMSKFEVTFEQYDHFCEQTKRNKPKDQGWGRAIRPVIYVSWEDGVAFTEWLSKKSGKKFRLPTEAEWEYAARAGSSTFFYWGNSLGRSNANCDGCGSNFDNQKTSVVGSFSPNKFGLFDMSGNVYEWCLDVWHENYQDAPTDGSAWVSGDHQELKVTRGGSWRQPPAEVTSSKRCYHRKTNTREEVGLRLVMEP